MSQDEFVNLFRTLLSSKLFREVISAPLKFHFRDARVYRKIPHEVVKKKKNYVADGKNDKSGCSRKNQLPGQSNKRSWNGKSKRNPHNWQFPGAARRRRIFSREKCIYTKKKKKKTEKLLIPLISRVIVAMP